MGLLVTPIALDFARSYVSRLDSLDWNHVNTIYEEMEAEALSSLIESGASRDEIIFERTADMRYVGQFYEIPSAIPNGILGSRHVSEITEIFYQSYERAFGRYMTDAPIQGLTWRLRAQCPAPTVEVKFAEKQDKTEMEALKGKRKAYFPEQKQFVECPVYERYRIKSGTTLKGPVILEERESTTIVGVDSEVHVDDRFNLIIERML